MSSITPDAVREEIRENAIQVGNPVKTAAKVMGLTSYLIYSDSSSKLAGTAVTASKPVYIDSSSVPQTGAFPFAVPVSIGATDTTVGVLNLTGYSTLSGSNDLGSTLVAGAAVTTFSINGYARVQLTDSGGNIVNGSYYVQLGTIT